MKTQQLAIKTEQSKLKTCAFTGHRELAFGFSARALKKAVEGLILQGVDTFYNGMAMGFDLIAAETVLKLKKKYPFIKLIACIPCYNQERGFSEKDKKRYVSILKKAEERTYVSEFYFNGCMQKRDRYMADRADALVAYLKKETGGTAYTVRYFQNKYPSKEIVFL